MFGTIAIALMAWDWHVQKTCIVYDAGRPYWCELPRYVLGTLNLPGVAASQLVIDPFSLFAPMTYLVELPFIVAWWWFVGTRFDFGLLGVGTYRRRKIWLTYLVTIALACAGLLASSILSEISFHQRYATAGEYGMMWIWGYRSLFLDLWLIALALLSFIAAFRVSKGQSGLMSRALITPSARVRIGIAAALYLAMSAGVHWQIRAAELRGQAEWDRKSIVVRGKVLDDAGRPVSGIEVNLVPLDDRPDLQSIRKTTGWTTASGDYILRPENAGRYFVAVLWNEGPFEALPFLTGYYPDSLDQQHAETLEIAEARHLDLKPIRLHRLELVKVPVRALWSNGKPAPEASFLFQNTLFLHEAGVGSASMIPDKEGNVKLVAGFDYVGVAAVQCDAGSKIAQHETSRIALSTKASSIAHEPIQFIFAGSPCDVWHSK